jgi:hypothetical protein
MEELDLGKSTIVYEDPEEGRTETTVDNEEVLYVRDHWVFSTGTDDQGNDLMRQIPRQRVYYVERNVEKFEEEARTLRHRVESIADDVRDLLPVDVPLGRRKGEHTEEPPSTSTTVHIEPENPPDHDESGGETGDREEDRTEEQ